MTQSINKYDFSQKPDPKGLAEFNANKAAEQVKQLKKSFDAPAVKTVKQGLVPAPKAAKTSPVKKSGRVVGISKDENEMLYNLLDAVNKGLHEDDIFATISGKYAEAFDKLIGRYNK